MNYSKRIKLALITLALLAVPLALTGCTDKDSPPKPVNTGGEQYLESIRQDGLTDREAK